MRDRVSLEVIINELDEIFHGERSLYFSNTGKFWLEHVNSRLPNELFERISVEQRVECASELSLLSQREKELIVHDLSEHISVIHGMVICGLDVKFDEITFRDRLERWRNSEDVITPLFDPTLPVLNPVVVNCPIPFPASHLRHSRVGVGLTSDCQLLEMGICQPGLSVPVTRMRHFAGLGHLDPPLLSFGARATMRPVGAFLKWAGGKARLAPLIAERAPAEFKHYHEPFLGGGAVFFALHEAGKISVARLADGNGELVDAYLVVRDEVEKLIRHLRDHEREYNSRTGVSRSSYYYKVRDDFYPTSRAGKAARLIFLNKTCYNGLYRVNSKGQFNVPHGSYDNPRILDRPGLREASKALACAEIETNDFEEACEKARPGDFVYLDPPYQPLSATSAFTQYTSADFGFADQERLRNVFDDLTARGVPALLSNSDHPDIRALYEGYKIEDVPMGRNINSKADGRGAINELLISNREHIRDR